MVEKGLFIFIGGEIGSVYTVKHDRVWLNCCNCCVLFRCAFVWTTYYFLCICLVLLISVWNVCAPAPSCPRLRRTISCLAPMLPSMASSSLAFMSLDFLKVRLFIRSNAFFPCMVNTTWALFPWGREWVNGQRTTAGKLFAAQHSSKAKQSKAG